MSAVQHPEPLLPAPWDRQPVQTLPPNDFGHIIFTRQLWQRNMPVSSPSERVVLNKSQGQNSNPSDNTGLGPSKRTSSTISIRSCRRSLSLHRGAKTPLTPEESSPFCTTRKRNAGIVDEEDEELESANSTPAHTPDNSGDLAIHVCICQPEPKIPRPRNAFILYRQHNQAKVVAQNPGLSNPEISKIIGEQWQNQPPEVKNKWKALAEEEKLRHQQLYPTYRYQPKRNSRRHSLSFDSANSDKSKCAKCGGQSILAPFSANTSQGATPAFTAPQTPISVITPVSRTLPVLRDLSLQSPAARRLGKSFPNAMSPNHNGNAVERDELGPLSPEMKRRRFNGDHPPPFTRFSPPRYGRVSPGAPVGPGTSFPFNQAPPSYAYPQTIVQVRRESLPGLRGMGSPSGVMGPPPMPRMGYQQHRLSQGHITHDRSLKLPPLQTGSVSGPSGVAAIAGSGKTAEEQIMSMAFQYKVKVLSQVAPPAATSETLRGPLVAIEGEDPGAVIEIGTWLHDELKKNDEISVRLLDGPDVSAHAEKKPMVQYHLLATEWLNKTDEIVAAISLPPKARALDFEMDGASPIPESDRPSRDIDEIYDNTEFLPKDRAPKQFGDSVDAPPWDKHPFVISDEEQMDVDANPAPTDSCISTVNAFPPDARKPVAIISNFSLHASNVFACRIPIGPHDPYSPSDHWQWTATQWRGIVGPDLTIFVRDAVTGESGRPTVEISTEGNLFIVKRTRSETDKALELEPSLLRRLGFEVSEWIRAFGAEKRGCA